MNREAELAFRNIAVEYKVALQVENNQQTRLRIWRRDDAEVQSWHRTHGWDLAVILCTQTSRAQSVDATLDTILVVKQPENMYNRLVERFNQIYMEQTTSQNLVKGQIHSQVPGQSSPGRSRVSVAPNTAAQGSKGSSPGASTSRTIPLSGSRGGRARSKSPERLGTKRPRT
jgi:hypothetical protein